MPKLQKFCYWCGKEFFVNKSYSYRTYCSVPCGRADMNDRGKETKYRMSPNPRLTQKTIEASTDKPVECLVKNLSANASPSSVPTQGFQ